MKIKITAIFALVMLLSLFFSVPVFAGTINYTYDNAGRLTMADFGTNKSITYTYDNNGNLLQRNTQTTLALPADINGDGDVDLEDCILFVKLISNPDTPPAVNLNADINNDGKIGIAEMIFIFQRIAGVQ